MSGVVSITGVDTLTINDRILSDFADGAVSEFTFPNDLVTMKTGKNGNTIYANNATGQQCEATLRIVRGSPDDKFLNALLLSQIGNFSAFTLMTGTFVKNVGDGNGNIIQDTYVLSGGMFRKPPEAMENVDGEISQSVAIYNLIFSKAPRALG